ncbi:MBL fold metallo-hydrolase [Candidatus Bathyarchaeota archaeon]|nr:MBL fold metallo-hydrolase [Candidatus Bathyarchaeota archaeon]
MDITIKWLSHASFQISIEGKIVYVDLEEKSSISKKADIILITHSHFDHCHPDKVDEALKENTVIIAPEDCSSKLNRNVKTLRPGEEETYGKIKIRAVEAYNHKRFRSPGNPYHPKGFGVGYLIEANGKTIYHAGDTDFIPEMNNLGKIDVAMIPSGGTYTMDNSDAAEATLAINPKIVIPMHRWDTDAQIFKEKVEVDSNITAAVLKEGEEYRLR